MSFDKIFVFCDKVCVCSDKCVFIIVKIKYVNFGNISNIYDKLNFITNYTYFTIIDIYIIKTHISIIIFDTFYGTFPPQNLCISDI